MSPLSLAFIIILSIAAGFLLGLLFHIRRTSAEMQRLKEAEVQARTLLESERRHAAENRKAEAAALRSEFRAVAEDLIQHESSALRKAHLHTLEDLLAPLGKDIEDFRDRFVSGHAAMDKYVKALMDTTASVSREAGELARALTANNKAQGNWGEAVLRNILEASGLTAGRDFTLQARTRDDEGREFIPDVVVHLPEQRAVVIDSKVSLIAYTRYASAQTPEEQAACLKEHVRSLRAHVKELSAKSYDKLVEHNIGYVLMFVPSEAAYMSAISADPALPLDAYKSHVILINPGNLLMALQLAYNLWQSSLREQNVSQIYESAEKIHKKFVTFAQNFVKIGNGISQLSATYEEAAKQLSTGRGNIVSQLEGWKKKGLVPRTEIPKELIEE
ncbi:MAG: DNA recombination protein RmuC [Bacteroidales bacterium]|nr:DNA recombination protein RmuC [Bacteroidales bacterium]